MHPIADKAEITVDFPQKFYMGQFGHHSSFDAAIETDGVLIRLSRQDDGKREAQIHLHYCCLPMSSQRLPAPSPATHRSRPSIAIP